MLSVAAVRASDVFPKMMKQTDEVNKEGTEKY